MARESTVVFKGIKPITERYPESQKETVAELLVTDSGTCSTSTTRLLCAKL